MTQNNAQQNLEPDKRHTVDLCKSVLLGRLPVKIGVFFVARLPVNGSVCWSKGSQGYGVSGQGVCRCRLA